MPTLPKLDCPNCGKAMGPVSAQNIPPATTFEDCLRRCNKCMIGATNAKNTNKVKFIRGPQPPAAPELPPETPKMPPGTPPLPSETMP